MALPKNKNNIAQIKVLKEKLKVEDFVFDSKINFSNHSLAAIVSWRKCRERERAEREYYAIMFND